MSTKESKLNGKKASLKRGKSIMKRAPWRVELNRVRIMGILLLYMIAANLPVISQMDFINNYDLGINLEYWEKNTVFFYSLVFWLNLFLYSLLVVWVANSIIKDKIITYCSVILPLYWIFVFIRSVEDVNSESELIVPNLKYFIYGLLLAALIIFLIRIIFMMVTLRTEETIDDLEQFKRSALERLAEINPYLNQQLLQEVVGKHGESFNLLLAAGQEQDERKKQLLTRLALITMVPPDDRAKFDSKLN